MDKIESAIRKIYKFLLNKSGMILCLLFIFGMLFKVKTPGIDKIIFWIIDEVLKSIPLSVVEGLNQFLNWVYKDIFCSVSIFWIIGAILYMIILRIKKTKEKCDDSVYITFRHSWYYKNIITKIWFAFIAQIWYLYKISELIISRDITLTLNADYLCFAFSVVFVFIFFISAFQPHDKKD